MNEPTDPLVPSDNAAGTATAAALADPPFTPAEVRTALRRPGELLELVLSRRQRLAATIANGESPWLLVAALGTCTLLASIPFALVRGLGDWWKVAALFGGAAAICFPSLHVFGAYLGGRLRPTGNLALALLISGVAALFTLGLAPIAWFLGVTMKAGDLVDADKSSLAMLGGALLAGLAHVSRCTSKNRDLLAKSSLPLLLAWQCLVVFVAIRMARALGLIA